MTDLPATFQKTNVKQTASSLVTLIIIIVSLLLLAGLSWALIRANQGQIKSGPAPDFSVRLFDGRTFILGEQRAKIVLINFWASWCIPCHVEAPELNTIWREYQDRGVVLVGVDYLDTEIDAHNFLQAFNVQYANGADIGTKIADNFHVKAVPETYIVDKQGNIAITFPAPTTAIALRPILDNLLAQK